MDKLNMGASLRDRAGRASPRAGSRLGHPAAIASADLEAAIRIALSSHAGQKDKAGAAYILHPLRVMLACETVQQKIVGVLHDVVEDSGLTISDIEDMFGSDVSEAIDALTKRSGESYTGFILRCGDNNLARYVKQRDLADNMDLARLGREPTAEDAHRQRKYADARGLLAALDRANFAIAKDAPE